MADSATRIVLEFACEDGNNHNFSYNHSKELPDPDGVKAVGQAMITNGSIFSNVPVKLLSAKTVVTQSNNIDISD